MHRQSRRIPRRSPGKHGRLSPLMLIGLSVPFVLALIATAAFVLPRIGSHAATTNMDCTILVPSNPLSAQGLATPYQLTATDAANGPCNEANPNQSAFVQGVIYDPATGAFSVYSPLVIDAGTQPAIAPTAPTLPQGAVVALWFGFNGNNLKLQGATRRTLNEARCVNGLPGSIFGQFSYCNADAFYRAANRGIASGKVQVPALQMGNDGLPCPTVRDFGIVDQDPSDNVQTQYLANANGQTAQLTAANQTQLANATTLGNPSDNALVTRVLDPVLGCTPWTAPNLADNNAAVAALPLDELMAAADQQAPIALVPINDPMTLNNGNPSLQKTNLYRRGTDQPLAFNQNQAGGAAYCRKMIQGGMARLQKDQALFTNAASPMADVANSLFTFLANRLQQSFVNLGCQHLLNIANPVTVQTDGNGVVTSATFGTGGAAGTATATTTATVSATTTVTATATNTTGNNGGVQQTAQGNAFFALDANGQNVAVELHVSYPNHSNMSVQAQVRTDSCTGNIVASNAINLDNQGAAPFNTVVQNVQATALPANWFFVVTDSAQQNAVVGCGIVKANGTLGRARLGVLN
ncbi:MAG TPA: hypothetical protein VGT44_02270 [Ktedonobacteraceae bacterium]|nr:hypothetical protein [Ktedonobacteraceae bacterium]